MRPRLGSRRCLAVAEPAASARRLPGRLTVRRVETAPPGKHEDGDGLRLVVSRSGARRWVFRYRFGGRRREMGLGSYPVVGLAEARQAAAAMRGLLASGVDPLERCHERERSAAPPGFTAAAARYIREHRRVWKNRKHARQWVSTLKTYARPVMGRVRIDQIATPHVLDVLRPIWREKPETAKRVQSRIESILDYAAAHGWRDAANPARWRGHLDKLLPKPSKVKRVRHHPAMPFAEAPAFMAELRTLPGLAARALELVILSAVRTGEALAARWEEIDLEGRVWTIPAERMKAKREHRVPLSDQAAALLKRLPSLGGSPYVFPGSRRGRPLSNMALLKRMRDMGFGPGGARGPYVPHGFRSSFRDWAAETTPFAREVVEMALAHAIADKTEAAYRRGDLFAKRRSLMQAWADYLLGARPGATRRKARRIERLSRARRGLRCA